MGWRARMPKLLVIEDEESSRELYVDVLREEGYEVTAAANGLEAMLALEEQDFDLIMTDLKMPEVDGGNLAVHYGHKRPDVPFVVVTAYRKFEEEVLRSAPNVKAYLVKPVDLEVLKETIRAALRPTG